MATKCGGYTWWYMYIYNINCSGQSLSDGKDQSLSAKVWKTLEQLTFLNSLPNIELFRIAFISTHTQLSG